MKAKRIPIEEFLPLYLSAYESGITREEFAESIGLKPLTVYQRVYELRAGDKSIPVLKSSGRSTTKDKVQKIMADYRKKAKKSSPSPVTVSDESMDESEVDPLAELLN